MTPVWRRGILAALGTACLAGITQAGEHVDWLDDSKVMLKLGPTYGDAVIESHRTQLGTLFAPGARPFAGAKICILTQDEGLRGAISGPLTAFAPVFEELSSARSATRRRHAAADDGAQGELRG